MLKIVRYCWAFCFCALSHERLKRMEHKLIREHLWITMILIFQEFYLLRHTGVSLHHPCNNLAYCCLKQHPIALHRISKSKSCAKLFLLLELCQISTNCNDQLLGKWLKLYDVSRVSTSPNSCHHTTTLLSTQM